MVGALLWCVATAVVPAPALKRLMWQADTKPALTFNTGVDEVPDEAIKRA
ncbi:MAG: hypothetical protein K2X82_32275 [Gemmataceae bacterium]|nr:hypothetical protein [Gemmataceae bacterium]